MLDYTKSFIEKQFPVSRISKESYKERKAGSSQTLTKIGKFWGRKPTFLVRATLLGLLMPVSDNPVEDREIFLKILTMDNDGLWFRKTKPINIKEIYNSLTPKERSCFFTSVSTSDNANYIKGLTKENKDYLQKLVFNRMSYDKKIIYCERPENVELQDKYTWTKINNHLGTNASSLQELVKELGMKRYGHIPRVGDCFAGGGSVPFESAKMGLDVYASDLNPIAGLLTWSNLSISSLSKEELKNLKNFQEKVYDLVCKQIDEWGIEKNEKSWRAKYYLYCTETICPECGTKVPLSPSWIISDSYKVIAELQYNKNNSNFDILVKSDVSKEELKNAKDMATIKDGKMYCPYCKKTTSISALRNDCKNKSNATEYGLRLWNKGNFIPQEKDCYHERLYCIKYIDKFIEKTWEELMKKPAPATDSCYGNIHYCTPTIEDIHREEKVIKILCDKFNEWQYRGYIPSNPIEEGYNTTQLIREKGWKYWHQLFNPRQLLTLGLFMEYIDKLSRNKYEKVIGLLGINKCADWNSKLSIWNTARDVAQATYTNQALNTLFNHPSRATSSMYPTWSFTLNRENINSNYIVKLKDAREIDTTCEYWITDPPYADAVNYHELTEFFLAWDKKLLKKAFPEWYTDSKRALAIKGAGLPFSNSMIDVYKNLTKHMPDNGTQVVMFTHQDVKVWSELAMILWSSGLQVISAWNIATETESGGLKSGNYVKGTVLLTLKKQTSNETAFQSDLYDEIKFEVEGMIDSMKNLDEKDEPDFTDADYLLASYASSLKVLTKYKEIDGIDINYWLAQPIDSKEENPIEKLIHKAVKIAYDYLIPEGFDKSCWIDLTAEERFYIRGLELEKNGNYKIGSYQELARGFGINDYDDLFAEFKANSTRLKTPSEFKMKNLGNGGFGSSLIRYLLVALNETTNSGLTDSGIDYLKSIYKEDFWFKKSVMCEVLNFISQLGVMDNMQKWSSHSNSARILKEALKNEGI